MIASRPVAMCGSHPTTVGGARESADRPASPCRGWSVCHGVEVVCRSVAAAVDRPHRVYDTCMAKVRTNIEIEDDYVQTIMHRYRLRTKTEVVDLALRRLAAEPMTRDEALAMRGSHSVAEVPTDQPPRSVAA